MNKEILVDLYKEKTGQKPSGIEMLPSSGSDRQYVRLSGANASLLGVYNSNIDENEAYFSFTNSFQKVGINVPKVELIANNRQYYLVKDLGDDLLYNHVINCNGELTTDLIDWYKKALSSLVDMQVSLSDQIDYSKCFPVDTFNENAIQWDLNYFKYNYLKLAGVDFDEFELEADFEKLKAYLLNEPMDYFMFRDFQSRNIILKDGEPYFIDFQGGRKGPLTYDVASLLYQAKAQLSNKLRLELFDYYANELEGKIDVDYIGLKRSYFAFALLRTLQVLGAYGFRGYFEKKPHFIGSIPFAIQNLKDLLFDSELHLELPHLKKLAKNLRVPKYGNFSHKDKLTVSITSFSYRKGIPADPSQNGGGFVFDCRSIHNPGRYKEYQHLTGKDKPVIDFFEKEDEMDAFLDSVFKLVDRSVEVYINREFKHLMVNFGCTGGQHRSVYSAEHLAKHLQQKFDVYISVWHREQDK